MRQVQRDILLTMLLAGVVIYFAHQFSEAQRGTDFPSFYAAARMVIEGHGNQLYDVSAQDRYLIRYSGRSGIYFIHPPFETLIYLPFCLFSLRTAYTLWCGLNAALLILAAKLFTHARAWSRNWSILVPLFLLFVPLLLNFYHGQDSLLLLSVLMAAFVAQEKGRAFAAGCLLACGLFKFHLVLPIAIPLVMIGGKRLLSGFTVIAAALTFISVMVSGWSWFISYPYLLEHLRDVPWAGVHYEQMANLRGVINVLLRSHRAVAFALVLLGSGAVLWAEIDSTRLVKASSAGMNLVCASAVMASLLVGYHLSPQDFTILLLPIFSLAQHIVTTHGMPGSTRILMAASVGVLFLPPLYLVLLRHYVFTYACVPLTLLFALTIVEMRRISGPRTHETMAQRGQAA